MSGGVKPPALRETDKHLTESVAPSGVGLPLAVCRLPAVRLLDLWPEQGTEPRLESEYSESTEILRKDCPDRCYP